jgi:DNA-binding response OmpR family regulator
MFQRAADNFAGPRSSAGGTGQGAVERTLTILVVEDDQAVAELLRTVINGTPGWGAVVVHHAAGALEVMRHVPVDLLVLDVNLPGMSGPELLNQVRAELGQDAPPVVFTSAGVGLPDVQRSLRHGTVDCFVPKPFDLDEIIAAMRSATEMHQRRLEMQTHGSPRSNGTRWKAA